MAHPEEARCTEAGRDRAGADVCPCCRHRCRQPQCPSGHAYIEQARGFNAFGEQTGETVTIPVSEGALALCLVPLPSSLRDQLAKLLGADPNSGAFTWGGWTTDIGLIIAGGGEDVLEIGTEKAATEVAGSEGRALEEELAGACGKNSFAGNTPVLMADGTSKPIDKIKAGDKIANAHLAATTVGVN